MADSTLEEKKRRKSSLAKEKRKIEPLLFFWHTTIKNCSQSQNFVRRNILSIFLLTPFFICCLDKTINVFYITRKEKLGFILAAIYLLLHNVSFSQADNSTITLNAANQQPNKKKLFWMSPIFLFFFLENNKLFFFSIFSISEQT
jgi:amino acid permease